MNCKKCGAPLDSDARFCTVCGEPVNSNEIPAADSASADQSATESNVNNNYIPNEEPNKTSAAPPNNGPYASADAAAFDANTMHYNSPNGTPFTMPYTASTPVPEEPKKNGSKIPIKVTTIIALAIGLVLIIIGIVRITAGGSMLDYASFGGDFYTYTYQGIVELSEMLATIKVTLGWIIVAIGAAVDAVAILHIHIKKKK